MGPVACSPRGFPSEQQATSALRCCSKQLSEGALSAALYFDLFGHVLSADELWAFLPVEADWYAFRRALLHSVLVPIGGFWCLPGREELVSLRKERERRARQLMVAARWVGRFLAGVPFVRAVFLSGQLSKGVADPGADVDLFLITAERRLWIVRSLLIAFKKSALLNSRRFLCLNYLVTEAHLRIPERNLFTATELVTLRPLWGEAYRSRLLQANAWLWRFLPNTPWPIPQGDNAPRRPLGRAPCTRLCDEIDERLRRFWVHTWARRYPHLSPEERARRFRSTPFASKAHPEDFQDRILSAYADRLRLWGLERLLYWEDIDADSGS
nr:MAG: hypothetical protein KatS3mg041_0146 [Bacteroidota bacterium]